MQSSRIVKQQAEECERKIKKKKSSNHSRGIIQGRQMQGTK
jgi:hypothetical protein